MRTVTASVVALMMVMAVTGIGWAETATPSSIGTTASLVNLELQNTTVVEGIRALFQGRGVPYIVDPGVKGKIVELTLKGVTFDQALKAFLDAADLTYEIESGTYIIRPAKVAPRAGQTAQRSTADQGKTPRQQTQQPEAVSETVDGQAQVDQPGAVVAPNTQVYVSQNAPVVYGQPGGLGIVDPGYYGPGFYQAGNLRFAYGWSPMTISDYPYVIGYGPVAPPPPGWVSPEMERLLRAQWAFQQQPYFITPY